MLIPSYYKKRIKTIANILLETSGLNIFAKKRTRENVTARMIASYQLQTEGLTTTMIGSLIGKNHSTVTFYIERMRTALKIPGYEAELEIYEAFKKKLEEYDLAEEEALKNI